MRDRWYGDNRDIVKWAALIHLARRHKIRVILQIALYRPDLGSLMLQNESLKGITASEFPREVIKHFPRRLNDIARLARRTRLKLEVFNDTFRHRDWREYLRKASGLVASHRDENLDPDTGLAPDSGGDERHVRSREIR